MNIKELKSYLGCDDAFLILLMQKFIDEVNEIVATINTAAAVAEWGVVKTNAHKMLSSVRIFEMKEIIAILEKLEMEAESGKNTDIIKTKVKELSAHTEKIISDMAVSLQKIKSTQ
ncbi:MAG TPA: Hpt domain-containing protein [Bacteroidia bacterium]|nr:Hpt domain-containing protein [Bacteroidia bacterium]